MNSGFLRLLKPGLVDHVFDIGDDDIALRGAILIIQSFTQGKKQLSMQEVGVLKKNCESPYSCREGNWTDEE